MRHLLFVCTLNQWRSLTAEAIFKDRAGYAVRSVGTASNARRVVTAKDIQWADEIYVMEKKHQDILQQRFSPIMLDKKVRCLNIPDEFDYLDAELIALLKTSVVLDEYPKSD